MQWSLATEEERKREGQNFLRLLWASIAEQVIQIAARTYELDAEQTAAIRKAFKRHDIEFK